MTPGHLSQEDKSVVGGGREEGEGEEALEIILQISLMMAKRKSQGENWNIIFIYLYHIWYWVIAGGPWCSLNPDYQQKFLVARLSAHILSYMTITMTGKCMRISGLRTSAGETNREIWWMMNVDQSILYYIYEMTIQLSPQPNLFYFIKCGCTPGRSMYPRIYYCALFNIALYYCAFN